MAMISLKTNNILPLIDKWKVIFWGGAGRLQTSIYTLKK